MNLIGGMGNAAWILEELGKDGGEYNHDTLYLCIKFSKN